MSDQHQNQPFISVTETRKAHDRINTVDGHTTVKPSKLAWPSLVLPLSFTKVFKDPDSTQEKTKTSGQQEHSLEK